jgi:hypothetical protein
MVYKRCFNLIPSFILLLFLLQLPISFFAQSKSILTSWQVTARAAGNSSGFDIRIEQYRDKTNFFFKRLDSLRQRDMEKDFAYIEQRAAVKAATTVDEVTYQIEKLGAIIELFEVAGKDTLSYNAPLPDPVFKSLLDSLATLPVEILTTNTGQKNGSQVANGYSFHFIRFNGKKKTADFFVAQPTAISHPFLFRLVTQTLLFYRKEKKEAIITIAFTKTY